MYVESDGNTLEYTATGAVTNKQLILIGTKIGVAMNAAAAGEKVTVRIDGRFTGLAKKAGASTNWAAGGRVYYMTTGGVHKLTGVAAAGKLVGIGIATAATGATTAGVILSKAPSPLETQT